MWKKRIPSRTECGQSLVELALTITMLMILLAGTVDLGRAFFTYMAMRDAAQEGASYGSLHPSENNQIIQRVKDNLSRVVPDPVNDVDVVITITGAGCLGNMISIDVNYDEFPLTMPFLGWILGSQDLAIHATINDTILRPTCP